jgi:chemotaxis protein methyltransferase CheR
MIRVKAGIVLDDDKQYLVEARLLLLCKRKNLKTIDELIALARQSSITIEPEIINVMTTNETSFFRDIHPFEALKKKMLPEFMKQPASGTALNIWCAACSTGQEPYSVAMIIKENFPNPPCKINILATDLSSDVLAQAKEGRYTQIEINRGLPMPLLLKYFEKQGSDWHIKEELRKMIEFRQFNFNAPWPALPVMDIIFLRNVMIYFDLEAKKRILMGMHRLLRPQGALFLGGAETTLNIGVPYERAQAEGTSYYVPIK